MPHRIREYVTLLDSPINTYCIPFLSSIYPSTYYGNGDDTFLRDDLIPFLARLHNSDSSSCKYIEKHYPSWSEESLILDWEKNEKSWKSSRFIQERGDTDHPNKYRDYLQLKCRTKRNVLYSMYNFMNKSIFSVESLCHLIRPNCVFL